MNSLDSYNVLSFDVGFHTMSYVYYNIKKENLNKVKQMVKGDIPLENIIDLKLVGASNIIPKIKNYKKLTEHQTVYYGDRFAKSLSKKIPDVDILVIEDQTINARTNLLENALSCNFNPTFKPIHIKPSIKNEIAFREDLTFAEITSKYLTKPQKEHTSQNFEYFCETYGYENIKDNLGRFRYDISDAFCQSLMMFSTRSVKFELNEYGEEDIEYNILYEEKN